MKKGFSILVSILVCTIFLCQFATMACAGVLFQTSSESPKVGDVYEVVVTLSGENVAIYSYDLGYNPEVLSFISCDGASGTAADGIVKISYTRQGNEKIPSCVVKFNVILEGETYVGMSNLRVSDSASNELKNFTPQGVTIKTQPGAEAQATASPATTEARVEQVVPTTGSTDAQSASLGYYMAEESKQNTNTVSLEHETETEVSTKTTVTSAQKSSAKGNESIVGPSKDEKTLFIMCMGELLVIAILFVFMLRYRSKFLALEEDIYIN